MRAPSPETAGSKVGDQRHPRRRRVLFGIACLSIVSGVALSIWVFGIPLSWTADYDRASYARIKHAIAADPQHFCGKRLYDVLRELGLENAHWDDGNVQNLPGSSRLYHFRGFALYVSLDYMAEGVTEDMLLERGSPSEQLRGRDLLRIDPHIRPFVLIDGISNRQERMRRFWAEVDAEIRKINEQMKLQRQKRRDRQY